MVEAGRFSRFDNFFFRVEGISDEARVSPSANAVMGSRVLLLYRPFVPFLPLLFRRIEDGDDSITGLDGTIGRALFFDALFPALLRFFFGFAGSPTPFPLLSRLAVSVRLLLPSVLLFLTPELGWELDGDVSICSTVLYVSCDGDSTNSAENDVEISPSDPAKLRLVSTTPFLVFDPRLGDFFFFFVVFAVFITAFNIVGSDRSSVLSSGGEPISIALGFILRDDDRLLFRETSLRLFLLLVDLWSLADVRVE